MSKLQFHVPDKVRKAPPDTSTDTPSGRCRLLWGKSQFALINYHAPILMTLGLDHEKNQNILREINVTQL